MPFPSIDSPYRISSASTVNICIPVLLRSSVNCISSVCLRYGGSRVASMALQQQQRMPSLQPSAIHSSDSAASNNARLACLLTVIRRRYSSIWLLGMIGDGDPLRECTRRSDEVEGVEIR
jgi:hypothetical protein